MTRQTSIAAFNAIKENGLLSQRRWEVYEVVFANGPMTSAEAFRILNSGKPVRNLTQSRARFTELRDIGLLRECGDRPCNVTGHKAIVWDVTRNLPIKPGKSKKIKCPHCKGKGYFEQMGFKV